MSIHYKAIDITQRDDTESLSGYTIPASFRSALQRAGASLRRTVYLAEDVSLRSYAMVLGCHRPHTAQQKLSILTGNEALWDRLLAFAECRSSQAGAVVIKYEKTFNEGRSRSTLCDEYYRQTTDFTCGPAAVLDALRRRKLISVSNRAEELALWREATMAVACDPYGLALACAKRGANPVIYVSRGGVVLSPESGIGILDSKLAFDAQSNFENDSKKAGIKTVVRSLNAEFIGKIVDSGGIVVLLIDEFPMHGVTCPHWITVTERDKQSGALFVDDPWVEEKFGETIIDSCRMPIFPADLDSMIHYDAPRSAQAMIVL